MNSQFLTNYTETTFLEKIKDNLRHCSSFDFSVSFIKKAGLVLLFKDIEAAVERGAKGRLITSTYQNFTDIESLKSFYTLQNRCENFSCHLDYECFHDKSIFCDLLYCADCHKKMWYHTNTVNKDIHYFSCSNYVKDYRGTCLTRHYIRADSIATIVEMELRRLADYLVDDTERFAEILAKKSTKEWESEKKAAQGELTKAEMRIEMIPKLLKKLYEDNLSGKTSDDDYSILSQEYSVERDQLKKKILGLRDKLKGMEDRAGEREAFVKAIRKFMSMKTLTAPLLRELIDHIDVYEVEGQGKNKTQRVVIYYKFVGYLEIPNDLSRPTYSADLREGVSVEYITCDAGEDILDDESEADKKAE